MTLTLDQSMLINASDLSPLAPSFFTRVLLPDHIRRGNATKSKVRAFVEHVFADQKHRMGMKIRTIGLARARIKIGLANIAYNMRRLIFHERKAAA